VTAPPAPGGLPALLASPVAERIAVLATFAPENVPEPIRPDVEIACDVLADRAGHPEWMLKERHRIDVLARMLRAGGRDRLRRVRGQEPPRDAGSPLQRMLDAVIAGAAVEPEVLTEDELIAALRVGRWGAAAGSYGGMPELLPNGFWREGLEGRLALLETMRPVHELTRDGCVGRRAERDRLAAHLDAPGSSMRGLPALLVYGVGGVGKSTLVAQFVLDIVSSDRGGAWAYLDLDRPTLSSFEPLSLLTDVIRQVGAQFPAAKRWLVKLGDELDEGAKGAGFESDYAEEWREAIPVLAAAVDGACGGRLVVVLDTFEELEREEARRGEGRLGDAIYRMLVELSDHVPYFRLVVCGRAPARTFLAPDRPDQLLHVEVFRGDAAVEVVQHLYRQERGKVLAGGPAAAEPLDLDLAATVVATVGGSPLALKLAARVLALEGYPGLLDAADRARAVGWVREDFVRGFLYRRVLGHMQGIRRADVEALREVATAALVLRRVTRDLLAAVVLPAVGRTDLDPGAVLAGLGAETAFADRDGHGFRLREELRSPALLALRYDRPDLVDDVHLRAATWFAAHPEQPDATDEQAYHLLAVGDVIAVGRLDPGAIRAAERSAADLPAESRQLVADTIADPASLEGSVARRAREREREAAVQRALDAGALDEAAALLGDPASWGPTTTLHRHAAAIAEARGDLTEAVAAAERDVAAGDRAREPERFCAAAIHHALALERGGRSAASTAALTAADAEPWLGGQDLLRLEVQLNRLAVLERGGLDHDRWLLELDARTLLARAEPAAVRARPALVRLLAAALGRSEEAYVLEAVRSVGLGTTTYSSFLRDLATALADWDGSGPESGAVARAVGLPAVEGDTRSHLTDLWFSAVAGTSRDTVPLLDRAFSRKQPGPAVVEALRRIYLWWGIDPQDLAITDLAAEPPLDLDAAVPKFADPRVQRLAQVLAGAFPSDSDVLLLASRAGVDAAMIDLNQTARFRAYDLIGVAAQSGKLRDLVDAALADPAAAGFHDAIRDAVGRTDTEGGGSGGSTG